MHDDIIHCCTYVDVPKASSCCLFFLLPFSLRDVSELESRMDWSSGLRPLSSTFEAILILS